MRLAMVAKDLKSLSVEINAAVDMIRAVDFQSRPDNVFCSILHQNLTSLQLQILVIFSTTIERNILNKFTLSLQLTDDLSSKYSLSGDQLEPTWNK